MGSDELKSMRWKNLCKRLKDTLPPVCWWCGRPIDLNLSGRDPEGFSIDHVIPRYVAPHRTWDESNLRPAHYGCNSTRGAKPQPVQSSRPWK